MSALRFCFLTTFYPPYNFGGDGIGVQRLARGLVKRGHAVTVIHDADAYAVLNDGPAPDAPGSDPYGVEVITLRSVAPRLSTLMTQQTGRPIVNGTRLRGILSERRFDVVNFHNVSLIGGPALLGYGNGAVKLYFAHEHWLVCPTHILWRHDREQCDGRECFRCQLRHRRPPQLWRHTGLLERHLDDVDVFVAMSEFSRTKHQEFGFPREMVVLPYFLPDPDDDSRSAPRSRPHDRPYFLFVGRLERIKGIEVLLESFTHYEDADLLVIGDGTHGAALRRLAAGNPRVRFVGRVPTDALAPYYEHAIALLVPSIGFETFGIILIEAFSHRTPVIARRLGPFPEIVQQSGGGFLFDTCDDLLDAMRTLQRRPAERQRMGLAAYEAYRDRWSESAVIPQYLRIVNDARERRLQRQNVHAPSPTYVNAQMFGLYGSNLDDQR